MLDNIFSDTPTTHTVINSDCRNMKDLQDESIQLIVTSPPYWNIKDYGTENQIGFHDSYEKYIDDLNLVWSECNRVLSNGCRLCINIGDQFTRTSEYGRYKVISIKTDIIHYCESIGLDFMGTIIWQKQTNMSTTGGACIMGSYPYPRNGIVKIDYEYILLFKKLGEASAIDKEIKEQSKLTNEEWNKYFTGHWYFTGEKQREHKAMFPLELPTRLIKMFSYVGETILDPFLGSGTTMLAASNLERNSTGYELNPEYIGIIKRKVNREDLNII